MGKKREINFEKEIEIITLIQIEKTTISWKRIPLNLMAQPKLLSDIKKKKEKKRRIRFSEKRKSCMRSRMIAYTMEIQKLIIMELLRDLKSKQLGFSLIEITLWIVRISYQVVDIRLNQKDLEFFQKLKLAKKIIK